MPHQNRPGASSHALTSQVRGASQSAGSAQATTCREISRSSGRLHEGAPGDLLENLLDPCSMTRPVEPVLMPDAGPYEIAESYPSVIRGSEHERLSRVRARSGVADNDYRGCPASALRNDVRRGADRLCGPLPLRSSRPAGPIQTRRLAMSTIVAMAPYRHGPPGRRVVRPPRADVTWRHPAQRVRGSAWRGRWEGGGNRKAGPSERPRK